MSIFRIRNFQFGLLLATALSVLLWSAASHAYTPEQEQACSGDAFRLCSADIPNVDAVTACMVRNKSQLSPGCQVYFRPDPEPDVVDARPTRRPTVIKPAAPSKSATAKAGKSKKPSTKPAKPAKPAAT